MFFYSRDRGGEHPEQHLAGYAGLMQADAYAGFNRLYEAARKPGPIVEAACWAHARRKFFDLARINKAPIAIEAVDAHRCAVRHRARDQRPAAGSSAARAHRSAAGRSSRRWRPGCASSTPGSPPTAEVAKAIDYSLKRWDGLTRFLDDGRLCMTNNAAERALRGIAVGRHNWTFAGSDEGGRRAAAIYTLIETAKLNDLDPQAWLADVLARCWIIRQNGSATCCLELGTGTPCRRLTIRFKIERGSSLELPRLTLEPPVTWTPERIAFEQRRFFFYAFNGDLCIGGLLRELAGARSFRSPCRRKPSMPGPSF